jgi:hypothetical protein
MDKGNQCKGQMCTKASVIIISSARQECKTRVQDKGAKQQIKTVEQEKGFEGTRQRRGKTKVQDK